MFLLADARRKHCSKISTYLFLYAMLGYIFTRSGTSIAAMYAYWMIGLAILFLLCWWYGRFKQQQPTTALVRLL